jgi:hypothetical protein
MSRIIWRLSGWSSTTKMRLLMSFLPAAFFIMAISRKINPCSGSRFSRLPISSFRVPCQNWLSALRDGDHVLERSAPNIAQT